jgi:superfamily II DNA or RNA helicase
MYELRDYQEENFNQLRHSYAKGHRKVLYQAATGSGKTVVASMVAKLAVEKGNRVMPVAHRRELILQFANKLNEMSLNCGIVMAGEPLEVYKEIQVGSIQTLWRRFLKERKINLHTPNLIIIDEAHRSLSATYLKLMQAFPDAWVLGLTATPVRTDGRGLGHIYEDMVKSPSVQELTDMGHLVPVVPYGGSTADLKGIRTTAGDYNKKELEERMNLPNLVGDCVQNWLKHAEGRPTLSFCSGVKHSIALAEAYQAVGVKAVHVDANTHKEDRDQVLGKLASGEIDIITNCMVYTEGTDCPPISCIQSANPTKSISKYLQQLGRGMRPHKASGKEYCMFLDHSGATQRHGFVEEPIPWSLDTEGKLHVDVAKAREKSLKQFECVDCGHIWEGKIKCPMCGRKLELTGEMAEYTDAELVNLKRGTKKKKEPTYTKQQKCDFYQELLGYAKGLGRSTSNQYAKGWVAHKYRAKFGCWPKGHSNSPKYPSKMTLAYIRSQNIRFAKRKRGVVVDKEELR